MIVKLTYQKVSKNRDIEVKTSERNLLSVNPESARQLALELVNSWNLQTNGDVFALRDAVEVME